MEHIPLGTDSAVDQVTLPINPKALEGIGKHHTLQSAIADIIDNSIDAEATTVLVRFVQAGARVTAVQIVDNGKGMSPAGLKSAMTVGKTRDYKPDDLGHFGMGLKASSFSQAEELTVWTKAENGPPCGMRMKRSVMSSDSRVDILSEASAQAHLYAQDFGFEFSTGTIIQWTQVHGLSAADNIYDQTKWFENALVSLKLELSLIFHRLLAADALGIQLDVVNAEDNAPGPRSTLSPIDPFEYRQSAIEGYPTNLVGVVDGQEFTLVCHILPAGTVGQSARLLGTAREHHQGIFVYRRNRLQHLGGWSTLVANEKSLQLARVELDVGSGLDSHVKINPEKVGVQFSPALLTAVDRAVSSSGLDFRGYLNEARNAFKQSNRRAREHRRFAPMGRGFADRSRSLLASNERTIRPNAEAIHIHWQPMAIGLYEIDLASRTIYVNQKYRKILNGNARGSINDAQLLKTLLFLLVEHEFQKSHLQKTKQQEHFRFSLALEMALQQDIFQQNGTDENE